MTTEIEFCGARLPLTLVVAKYGNGRTAICAIDARTNERFGTLTINIPTAPLDADEIIVKMYSENEPWARQVLDAFPEAFTATGKYVGDGFVRCPVYKFEPGKLITTEEAS